MLEELAPGIWTVSAPLKLAGADLGTRMTVVRLSSGGLALFAPVPIDDALAAQLAKCGPVEALIAPNAFHHFYFLAAVKRYDDQRCTQASNCGRADPAEHGECDSAAAAANDA